MTIDDLLPENKAGDGLQREINAVIRRIAEEALKPENDDIAAILATAERAEDILPALSEAQQARVRAWIESENFGAVHAANEAYVIGWAGMVIVRSLL